MTAKLYFLFLIMQKDKCPTCHGFKRIMGLGMVESDCKRCNGIGIIDIPFKKEDSEKKSEPVALKTEINGHQYNMHVDSESTLLFPINGEKRKRGRPRKNIENETSI